MNMDTKEIIATSTKDFTPELVTAIAGEKAAERGRGIDARFKLKQVFNK